MNELLSVVVDFNVDVIGEHLDLQTFLASLIRFLSLFRMQSGLSQSRIYLAFPTRAYLLYPLDQASPPSDANPHSNSASDVTLMHTMQFQTLKETLLERVCLLIEQNCAKLGSKGANGTLVHQAIMKAACYSQQWIKQV